MLLSDELLKKTIAGQTVGDSAPYSSGTQESIEKHLERVAAGLKRSHLLDVDAEFNHYGSGYASFVEVFCVKRGGRSRTGNDSIGWRIDGISVYLSRLAPFAVFGATERTQKGNCSGRHFLHANIVGTLPPGQWEREIQEIRKKLTVYYGFTFLERADLERKLPFKAHIWTALSDPRHYQVFDAIFYWED